jgi:hypothetical protein
MAQPDSLPAGQMTVVSGGGFPAGSQLDVNLFSNGVLLATTTADSAGRYQVSVTVPAGTVPGTHTLVVSTPSGTPAAQTLLIVTAAPVLSFTGADIRGPTTLAALLVIAGLFAIVVTWRRRPIDWRPRHQ